MISENVQIQLITSVMSFAGLVLTATMTYLIRRLDIRQSQQAKITAGHVEQVKTTLADTMATTDKKLNDIHELVNGRLGQVLKALAEALRRTANDSRHPEDVIAADNADANYKQHEMEQGNVDLKSPREVSS